MRPSFDWALPFDHLSISKGYIYKIYQIGDKSHQKLATVTTVRPISRFGSLNIDETGSVSSFIEKPRSDGWINAGFFVFNRGIFDYLGGDECILERDPLERLAAEGQLIAYRHEGFFFAMDTYREYLHLNDLWAGAKTPWKVWE